MSHRVPDSAVEITSSWLASVLAGAFPAGEARLLRSERIGEDFGFASEVVRCHLGGIPRSVVVKTWATDGQADTREASFYASFAQRLGVRAPRCHHAAIDLERKRGVLVLEDFPEAVQGDCLETLDAHGAAVVARALAALHAQWWARPELASAEWLPSLHVVERASDWLRSRSEQFLRRFGDRADPEVLRLLGRAEIAQARANQRLAEAPVTFLHADLHLDNLLFDGDSAHPVWLDWARVAQGPGALDLAELLFAMTPLEQFDPTLASYARELERHGVTGIDETSLRRQLGGALLRKFIRETCGIAGWEPRSRREWAILESTLARLARALAMWRGRDPELFRL